MTDKATTTLGVPHEVGITFSLIGALGLELRQVTRPNRGLDDRCRNIISRAQLGKPGRVGLPGHE